MKNCYKSGIYVGIPRYTFNIIFKTRFKISETDLKKLLHNFRHYMLQVCQKSRDILEIYLLFMFSSHILNGFQFGYHVKNY